MQSNNLKIQSSHALTGLEIVRLINAIKSTTGFDYRYTPLKLIDTAATVVMLLGKTPKLNAQNARIVSKVISAWFLGACYGLPYVYWTES